MKISLITVSYNSERTLRDTMESVLSQSYTNIEYIIVDGGSNDRTTEIIHEYEPRFKERLHWISESDKGLYDAMNKGIRMATGDIIGIINSDDLLYDSDVIKEIVDCFRQKSVDCVYGNLEFVKEDNTNKVVRTWIGSQYKTEGFRKGWHPAHPTFYVKRNCYERLGGYDISFNISADFELMLRFIEKFQISNAYLNRSFVKMRMGGESTGSISKIIEGNKNVLRAFRKNQISVSPFYPIIRLLPKAINLIKTKFGIK